VSIKESGAIQAANGWQDIIQNHSASPIVALHATFSCNEEDGSRHTDINGSMDSIFQFGHDSAIPPGGSYAASVFGHAQCSGNAVDVVIFADGHIEGDVQKANAMYQRRRGAYMALTITIPLLNTIASQGATPQDVIQILQDRSKTLSNDKTLSGEETVGESFVFSTTITLLKSQFTVRTPSDFTPNRQPHIKDLAKEKNISLQQAHAAVLMNKFMEWKSALEGNTEIPEGQ
jgi:hypothetical protein